MYSKIIKIVNFKLLCQKIAKPLKKNIIVSIIYRRKTLLSRKPILAPIEHHNYPFVACSTHHPITPVLLQKICECRSWLEVGSSSSTSNTNTSGRRVRLPYVLHLDFPAWAFWISIADDLGGASATTKSCVSEYCI